MSEWSRNPPPPTPAPQTGRPLRVPLWLAAVAAGLTAVLGGFAGGATVALFRDGGDELRAPADERETARRELVDEESAITEAVEQALPAIVTIINDEAPRSDEFDVVNIGTGVIVDRRGYVVTNDHVVRESAKLRVILHDGTELPASVVSSDTPFSDVAVVRIQPQDVDPVPFGDSDGLKLGQRLIAVGTALGDYRETVTTGVVSGLHRRHRDDEIIVEDLIQTDAAVNHGFSGGPLLNTKGEMVGMNTTVIRGSTGGTTVEGVALSLSSNVIRPIVEAIIERGRYDRTYIGVVHQDIDPRLAALSRLPVDRGAIIVRVTEGSPADEAGLERGDIILKMGDSELNEDLPFLNALAKLPPGETSTFRILRNGAEQSVEVRVALRP